MVKIVVISDTHNQHAQIKLPKGDILIHCGDFTGRGMVHESEHALAWLNIQAKIFKYVIFIAGNHDFNFDDRVKQFSRLSDNIYYLNDSGIELLGIKFWGSPWTPKFRDWAYMQSDGKLAVKWALIPENTEVLITHGPPYSILDLNIDNIACGSQTLYARIKQLPNLKYHLFGHIHEGYGREVIENITFCNCSVLNRWYELTNKPMKIEV